MLYPAVYSFPIFFCFCKSSQHVSVFFLLITTYYYITKSRFNFFVFFLLIIVLIICASTSRKITLFTLFKQLLLFSLSACETHTLKKILEHTQSRIRVQNFCSFSA